MAVSKRSGKMISPSASYGRGWGAPTLQWLGSSNAQWLNKLATLLFSNPVFSPRTALRPIGSQPAQIRRWIADEARLFVEQNLAQARDNDVFQALLENFITGLLAKCHYRNELLNSKVLPTHVSSGQFWFTPSYFVCGWVKAPEPRHLRVWFLGQAFFDEEFYKTGNGRRHPALVTDIDGTFCRMVPFSKASGGRGSLKTNVVELANGPSKTAYAICRFRYRAYERTLGGKDRKGMSVAADEFLRIQQELLRWS